MVRDKDVCLLNKKRASVGKKRILATDEDKPRLDCPGCDRNLLDPMVKVFTGQPENAMEEETALTHDCLLLYDEDCTVPDIDKKPMHRLTQFAVFDGEGHLCEFDTGLIEKNRQIFCSGYIKPIYDEDPSPRGGVPAHEIGPIELWWISGFDGGNNFLLALASPCAEYILMDPCGEYEEFMRGPRQKALLTKIVVEFLSNSYEPTFEELLTRIQEVTAPAGMDSFDENVLQQNAQFVVEQVLDLDDEGDLISTPAMKSVIELYNVKIKRRASVKRLEKQLKLSRAAMTPLVSDIFEGFFNRDEAYFSCDQATGVSRGRKLDSIQDSIGTELSSYSWEEGEEFAIVNGEVIRCGDFVCLSVRDSSARRRVFRIENFFRRNLTNQAHCTFYCSGTDTVIGESSDPYELFYVGECGDWPLCKIATKLDVVAIDRPDPSRFCDYRTETCEGKFFVQMKYTPEEGTFSDFDLGSCPCREKTIGLELYGGVSEPDGTTVYESVNWRGEVYSPGCCIFVEPFAITLDSQKSSRNIEKITVTLKADERIYPEIYRKGKETTETGDECPEPFKIGYVTRIYSKGEGKKVLFKINKFYRPEDTGLTKDSPLSDMHLLYWSDEEADIELEHVRGLCRVTYSNFSRDLDLSDEFYYQDRFDCETRTLRTAVEVPLVCRERPIETVKRLRTMNVFCGAGGLAEGLSQSGAVDIKWGIEIEESAAKAFKKNFPNAFVYQTDCNTFLRNVMNKKRDKTGQLYPGRDDVDFMCGGPPCQGFSTMNRFTAKQYSQFKNSLIVSYLSFCDYYRPKYFLLENVKNFVAFKKSSILKYTLACLIRMGYQCSFAVLQAGNYGVPQNRKRLFLLASAPGVPLPRFPSPTHVFYNLGNLDVEIDGVRYVAFRGLSSSSAPLRSVTIRDALHDLPPILKKSPRDEANAEPTPYQRFIMNTDTVIRDHVCKDLSPLNEARIKHIPAAKGCDWRDLPNIVVRLRDGTVTELLEYAHHDMKQGNSRSGLLRGVCPCASGKACHPKWRQSNTLIPWCLPHTANRNNNWTGLYGRLDWDGYFSTTITNPEPSCKQGRVLHPEEDRVVSVRECARSQGLPDSFRLHGTVMDRYRQVGNSVPPPLARAIGYEIGKSAAAFLNEPSSSSANSCS